MPDMACPHYLPANVGNPTILCPGCASLVTDHRHPQNQAAGLAAPTAVARPENRSQARPTTRRG